MALESHPQFFKNNTMFRKNHLFENRIFGLLESGSQSQKFEIIGQNS